MRITHSIRRRRVEPAELEPLAGVRTQGVQVRLEQRRRLDDDPSDWLRRARRRLR